MIHRFLKVWTLSIITFIMTLSTTSNAFVKEHSILLIGNQQEIRDCMPSHGPGDSVSRTRQEMSLLFCAIRKRSLSSGYMHEFTGST